MIFEVTINERRNCLPSRFKTILAVHIEETIVARRDGRAEKSSCILRLVQRSGSSGHPPSFCMQVLLMACIGGGGTGVAMQNISRQQYKLSKHRLLISLFDIFVFDFGPAGNALQEV